MSITSNPCDNQAMRSVLLIGVVCATAVAQSQTVRLSGRVVDGAGSAIAKGKVILMMAGQGEIMAETWSGQDGTFVFMDIRPGTYDLNVHATGFKSVVRVIEANLGRDIEVGPVVLQVEFNEAAALDITGSFVLPNSKVALNPNGDDSNIICVERLQMPTYVPLAKMARIEGTVTAMVSLSPNGLVQQVGTGKAHPLLAPSVKEAIRQAMFRSNCGGRTVVLIFHFNIRGEPSDYPKQSVSFGFPNHFWIVSEPYGLMVEVGKENE
jgi:hypothetical protein